MKTLGRNIILSWNSAPVAGVRTKGIQVNGEPVDFSDDDSGGFRELSAEAGRMELNIPISGILVDDSFRTVATGKDGRIGPATLTYPDGGVVSGNFYLSNYTENGEHEGEVTFDVELQSTGQFNYTASQ